MLLHYLFGCLFLSCKIQYFSSDAYGTKYKI